MLREAAERWRASERAITHWLFCSARTRAAIFLSKTLLTYGLIFIVDHSLRKLLHLAWTSALVLEPVGAGKSCSTSTCQTAANRPFGS